ncbi:hypothetical protein VTO42DRAFT_4769 [Malbranchea cinnamomea]
MTENMDEVHWPPRSPYEALISSPSGRKKAQEMFERRRLAQERAAFQHGTPYPRTKTSKLLDDDLGHGILDDEEDDEETLQLKLAAIEARLKLKKLQQNKAKVKNLASGVDTNSASSNSSKLQLASRSQAVQRSISPQRKKLADQEDVQVPLSPSKRLERPLDRVSPRRVRLGIDKGLHGCDVSLKWRPQQRDKQGGSRMKTEIDAPEGTRISRSTGAGLAAADKIVQKPKSFSERILEQRSAESADVARREKALNMQRKRSHAFAVDKRELESYHALAAAEKSEAPSTNIPASRRNQEIEFSRDDIINAYNRSNSVLQHNRTVHSSFEERLKPQSSNLQETQISATQTRTRANSVPRSSKTTVNLSRENSDRPPEKVPDPSKFEAYSGLHLSKRILPHSFLKRTFANATPMRIPDLLRTIKPPSFDPPDTDGDYVVFGIVASKSEPREHKENQKATAKEKDPYDDGTNNASKYMVLTLTDLKWSIDLFLFDTAFPRYYKLSQGTVIAILNPAVMPPPPHKIDTNAFSLTVSSSDDTILEIGTSSDIGFCKSIRKDGKVCEAWVDARKTEFCDFHVELQLRKTKAQRAGVNSGTGILGDRGGRGGGEKFSVKSREVLHYGLKPEGGGVYDRATGSTYYVAPPSAGRENINGFGHRSAASLLDTDDPFSSSGGLRRGGDKEERFRRRLAEQERERNIAKQLGKLKSVGSEYLRAQHNKTPSSSSNLQQNIHSSQQSSSSQSLPHIDTLGLNNLSKNANDVKLGRCKKRSFEVDKDTPKAANVEKKTRFITPKGIRVAGRDSMGDTTMTTAYDDDDDDLDIV